MAIAHGVAANGTRLLPPFAHNGVSADRTCATFRRFADAAAWASL
jgi:hypothetical protein